MMMDEPKPKPLTAGPRKQTAQRDEYYEDFFCAEEDDLDEDDNEEEEEEYMFYEEAEEGEDDNEEEEDEWGGGRGGGGGGGLSNIELLDLYEQECMAEMQSIGKSMDVTAEAGAEDLDLLGLDLLGLPMTMESAALESYLGSCGGSVSTDGTAELDEPYYGADVSTDTDPDHVELLCDIQAEKVKERCIEDSAFYMESADAQYMEYKPHTLLKSDEEVALKSTFMDMEIEAINRSEDRELAKVLMIEEGKEHRKIAEEKKPMTEFGDFIQKRSLHMPSRQSEERRGSPSRSQSRSRSRSPPLSALYSSRRLRRRSITPPSVKSRSQSGSESSSSEDVITPFAVLPRSQLRSNSASLVAESERRKVGIRSSSGSPASLLDSSDDDFREEEGGKGKKMDRDTRSR